MKKEEIIGVLFIVIFVLAYKFYNSLETNNVLIGNNQKIYEQNKKITESENLDLQAKCSKQAAIVFKELGYRSDKLVDSYENHYNSKLQKCFISIYQIDINNLITTRNLLDAFEKRQYASFMKNPHKNTVNCSLGLDIQEQRLCTNEAEYNAFEKEYM